MAVHYRSHELIINNEAIVELLSAQRFNLADLRRIRVVRRDADRSRRTTTNAVAGLLVLVAAASFFLDSPMGWATTALAIVASVGMGGASHLLKRARWQLQAVYRGADICLYSTTDERAFGQVRRGLIRALEANERHRAGRDGRTVILPS